jgi:hypothetical protein
VSLKYGILLLAAAQWTIAADPAAISLPRLGFVPDPATRSILAITGFPGAALVGEPVAADLDAAGAAIAPGQKFALFPKDGALVMLRFDEQPAVTAIDGLAAGRIVFSPSGSAAAVYDKAANRLQVVTGLPQSPAVSTLEIPEACDGIAVSDRAEVIAAGSSVWLLRAGSAPSALALGAPTAAAAFGPRANEALVAAAGRLTFIRLLPDGPQYQELASYDEAPAAVAFSSDASRAIMLTAGGDIRLFTTTGSELPGLSCHCTATGLQPLAGDSIFRLNEVSAGPLWLLDAGASPRLWFVPREVAE